ncbi:MAG: hypothetical protein AB2693_23360 [Candidatus Thiodiazotropha sp.]
MGAVSQLLSKQGDTLDVAVWISTGTGVLWSYGTGPWLNGPLGISMFER